MENRRKIAGASIGLGCVVLVAVALLHSIAGYPQVTAGIQASKLPADLGAAFRCLYLIVGWHWIAIAVIVAVAAFARVRAGKTVVLICGFALVVDAVLMASFLGWFAGTEMVVASSLLILCGGLLLAPAA